MSLRELTAVSGSWCSPDDPVDAHHAAPGGKAARPGLAAVTDVDSEPQPGHLAVANACHQVSHPDRLPNVHTAPPICPARSWPIGWRTPRLEQLASEAALLSDKRAAGLSRAEFKVILALCKGGR
ncbi:hypothetical protein LNP25_03085 [Klebsiella variicola subsp. variicola]|nr:hypothetical protein [Klebsiella variicola subsp. variicola]